MLRWREVAVFLVLASVVSGDLRADLRAVTEAVKKSKTDDFLSSFDAAYEGYLRLCRARNDVVTRKRPMEASLRSGLQDVDKQLQNTDPNFVALVKASDRKAPIIYLHKAITLSEKCDKLREAYLKAEGSTPQIHEKNREAALRYQQFCARAGEADDIVSGFDKIFNKFRNFTYNTPRKMDMFVRGMVKLLARIQVHELTNIQIPPNDEAKVDARLISMSKNMTKFIGDAKKVLKDIADGRMTQIKADLVRYLKDKSTMTMCGIAGTLLYYLREKYDSSDFGVLVFKGRYKSVAKICRGTYAFGVGDLNGIVVERRKSVDVEDRGVWMTEILNKLQDLKSNGEKHYAMMKQVLTTVGVQDVCKKLVLVAVIDTRASQCMMRGSFSYERRAKSVHRCNTSLCWIKRYWNYQVNLVG